ncbi:hypothetical protein FACS189497_00350 [Betaproteobacteria bacterium]|nr:hypothetical protein FACS189488_01150 [Betaproteobacteria bacterium]GHU27354.1 hypothetical protein FACS189497_00350 [Betaproteobacteria bacterium]
MGLRHLILFVHLTGIVFWVGGMVFIRVCLAPSALALGIWMEVLARFFSFSRIAIALILISGISRLLDPQIDTLPLAWQLMAVTGTAAIAVFASVGMGAWARLCTAARGGDKARIQTAMSRLGRCFDIVLVLVTLTATVATFGLGI